MRNNKRFTLVIVLMTMSFFVHAEKVYESVDSKGGVEFSDQPGENSQQIDVEPNVVHVVPVEPSNVPVTKSNNTNQLNMDRGINGVESEEGNLRRRTEEERLRRAREHNSRNDAPRAGEMKGSGITRAVEGGRHVGGRR